MLAYVYPKALNASDIQKNLGDGKEGSKLSTSTDIMSNVLVMLENQKCGYVKKTEQFEISKEGQEYISQSDSIYAL